MKTVLKNHVAVVLDVSYSMAGLTTKLKQVFDKQIQVLRDQSLLFEQETRVSVYTFSDFNNIKCLISDVDVARPMELEALRGNGNTALLDATALAIEDLRLLPQKYGDHAFIVYALTDGEENDSRKYSRTSVAFKNLLKSLPENFTVVGFVPDINGIKYLEGFGFAKGNIEKWDATERGLEEVGRTFEKTMNNYFTMRSTGTRSSTTVFSDLKGVSQTQIKSILKEVKPTDYEILINPGTKAVEIRDMVENSGLRYSKGKGYYELVKNEHVQPDKHVAVQNKKTGKIFTGDEARSLLKLPDYKVKVVPEDHGEWIVFIQSNSVNRKIIPKQRVLVFK